MEWPSNPKISCANLPPPKKTSGTRIPSLEPLQYLSCVNNAAVHHFSESRTNCNMGTLSPMLSLYIQSHELWKEKERGLALLLKCHRQTVSMVMDFLSSLTCPSAWVPVILGGYPAADTSDQEGHWQEGTLRSLDILIIKWLHPLQSPFGIGWGRSSSNAYIHTYIFRSLTSGEREGGVCVCGGGSQLMVTPRAFKAKDFLGGLPSTY